MEEHEGLEFEFTIPQDRTTDGGSVIPNALWQKIVEDMKKAEGLSIGRIAKKAKMTETFADLEGVLWEDTFGTVLHRDGTNVMVIGPDHKHNSDAWVSVLVLSGYLFGADPGQSVSVSSTFLGDWTIAK